MSVRCDELSYYIFSKVLYLFDFHHSCMNFDHLMREIKKYTGLNINDLKVKNGKFITDDEKDLVGIYGNKVRNAKYVDDYHKSSAIPFYDSLLNKYTQKISKI